MARKQENNPLQLSFDQQLSALICANENVEIDLEDKNFIRLKIHLKLNATARFVNHFFPVRNYRKYLLTSFSCTLYRLIREKPVCVRDLIRFLADREKLSFFEARNLVLSYVGLLMQRGLVVVEIQEGKTSGTSPDGEEARS